MTAYFYSRCSCMHLTRNRYDQRITKEPSLCNIIILLFLFWSVQSCISYVFYNLKDPHRHFQI